MIVYVFLSLLTTDHFVPGSYHHISLVMIPLLIFRREIYHLSVRYCSLFASKMKGSKAINPNRYAIQKQSVFYLWQGEGRLSQLVIRFKFCFCSSRLLKLKMCI